MRDINEVMKEITAADLRRGFAEYDRVRNETLYPHVFGPTRESIESGKTNMSAQMRESFRQLDSKNDPNP